MYVYIYVYIQIFIYIIYIYISIYFRRLIAVQVVQIISINTLHVCKYIYIYVDMNICIHAYVYMYISNIYAHVYRYKERNGKERGSLGSKAASAYAMPPAFVSLNHTLGIDNFLCSLSTYPASRAAQNATSLATFGQSSPAYEAISSPQRANGLPTFRAEIVRNHGTQSNISEFHRWSV